MNVRLSFFLMLLFGPLVLLEAHAVESLPSREENQQYAREQTAQWQNRYGDQPDVRIYPAVLADRKTRMVTLLAEATGVQNEPVEFFLIGERSGHAYEAVAVTFAQPSHVRDALLFLGLPAGRPVQYDRLAFWPKGERVLMHLAWRDNDTWSVPVRAEDFVMDGRTGLPLPRTGFVFTGSQFVPHPLSNHVEVLLADLYEPHSIASAYNEPQTILDVPRQAPQGDVYNFQVANTNLVLPQGRVLKITLQPMNAPNEPRRLEGALTLLPNEEDSPADQPRTQIRWQNVPDADQPDPFPTTDTALQHIQQWTGEGRDPFLTIQFDPDLTLAAAARACRLLAEAEGEQGPRFEPPQAGDIYFKAFVPNEAFRERANRMAQPWELHLVRDQETSAPVATLIQIQEIWTEQSLKPELHTTAFPVEHGAAIQSLLADIGPGLPVILVFADATLSYNDLMSFLRPVMNTHGTIHVFLTEPAAAKETH